MKYCQGTKCHEYRTKDRIRGTKGSKYYATRRRSDFYYGEGNFCSLNCQNDWLRENIERALNHFGRTTEAKRVECNSAWYKEYSWRHSSEGGSRHYFVNDLLGTRIPITEREYQDDNYKSPIRE
jgi:hypothetical protein|tara:strand:+ start:1076 stop:1447 length:372 start_codon:yes stop_codon:yes gene_type:complete